MIRNNVQQALAEVILRTATPVGVHKDDDTVGFGRIYLSDLWDAFAAIDGVDDFVILSPQNDVVLGFPGKISIPGQVVFV